MSRSVDLFIASPLPIEALAEHLRIRTGAQLMPTSDSARWRMTDGSLTADLYEHAYLDDGELWLSRYRYVLATQLGEGISLLDSSEVLGLRHLAQVLHDPPDLSVLLVLDLQYRLAAASGVAPEATAEEPRVVSSPGWGSATPGTPPHADAERESGPGTARFTEGERA